MLDAIAILHQLFDRDMGIERSKECGGEVEAGDDDRLAASHLGGEARIGIDRRVGGDVAPATEILGKDLADEFGGIEIFREWHDAALVAA
jgi:hypothetical protein